MKISLMCDTQDSYIHEYIHDFKKKIVSLGHNVNVIKNRRNIKKGDILFLLACSSILNENELKKNKKNIVIHPSKLPKGKGHAGLVWEILKGNFFFYLTMFEANSKVDAGNIYYQESFKLEGHELSDEIRYLQAKKTLNMIINFLKAKNLKPHKQIGKSSYSRRRTPEDSEVNINDTIKNQFNLLRVVDNKRYPAFIRFKGKKYVLKIFKENLKKQKKLY